MRKYFFAFVVAILFAGFTLPASSEATIADGTHSINYQVNKPGSNSTSLANDYFLKPAKLIVKNGKMSMQLTIKNSAWVTEFNPPGGAKVISTNESADQRVVQFPVSNPNLITIGMKIDIEDIDYHHAYSVDFVFDSSALPQAKTEERNEETKTTTPAPAPSTNAESPKQSSGSNTSSNIPAPSKEQDKNESSNGQASETTKTDDSTKTDDQNASNSAENEQAEQSEVVENPETSDELPIIVLLLFVAALIVFMHTKQHKTIG